MVKKPATESGKKVEELDVGGTSGTDKNDKYENEENKNKGSPARSTISSETCNWKITSATIPLNQIICSLYVLFGFGK